MGPCLGWCCWLAAPDVRDERVDGDVHLGADLGEPRVLMVPVQLELLLRDLGPLGVGHLAELAVDFVRGHRTVHRLPEVLETLELDVAQVAALLESRGHLGKLLVPELIEHLAGEFAGGDGPGAVLAAGAVGLGVREQAHCAGLLDDTGKGCGHGNSLKGTGWFE